MPAPFVLAIDVEPGPRYELSGAPSEWDGFERCVAHTNTWRNKVLETTGSPLVITWFVRCDAQLAAYGEPAWALKHFAPLLAQLRAQGDEVGLHVHPYRPTEEGSWRQDFSDEPALLHTIRTGIQQFEEQRGPVRFFRSGDGFLSDAVVALIDSLGVEYDLTLEPGRMPKPFPEPDLGMTADYRRAPRRAYHPAFGDFLRPDTAAGRRLWMVPLSTACFHHPRTLHPASLGHRIEMMHVAFDACFFQPFCDYELNADRPIVAVTRTGDVDWSPWLFDNFDYLFGHKDLAGVQFVSPAELVARNRASAW